MSIDPNNPETPVRLPSVETAAEPVPNRQPTSVVAREIIETLLLTFFIFWLVNSVVGRYRIDGNSMNPTLLNNEYLLISNFAYQLDEPERGDIVVFKHPHSELNLVKRVVGLPGETVEVQNGTVSVNGQLMSEPYIMAPPIYNNSWTVPAGEYFVLGDNRNHSSDSSAWGFLPEENILGRAELVYWPPKDWARVPHHIFSSG